MKALPDSGVDVNTGKPAATSAGRAFGWNVIHGPDGPYMTRIWIGRLRLHIFHRGDGDPDCHDHPWNFWTFPLTPYVEEVVDLVIGEEPKRRKQVVPAWRLSFRPAEHCHRVLGRWNGEWNHDFPPGSFEDDPLRWELEDPTVVSGKIITLVWVSKPRRKWGFLKNRDGEWCWVPWKEYVFGGGKQGPCE